MPPIIAQTPYLFDLLYATSPQQIEPMEIYAQ